MIIPGVRWEFSVNPANGGMCKVGESRCCLSGRTVFVPLCGISRKGWSCFTFAFVCVNCCCSILLGDARCHYRNLLRRESPSFCQREGEQVGGINSQLVRQYFNLLLKPACRQATQYGMGSCGAISSLPCELNEWLIIVFIGFTKSFQIRQPCGTLCRQIDTPP